jgi:nitrogen regulatory protein P-II 1
MKLITAILRPGKLDELIEVLIGNGARGLTVTEVRGFGQQLGQLAGQDPPSRPALLPKVRLDLVTLDDDAESLAEVISKHVRTQAFGDGKIWVTPVDRVLRVRTGERDRAAV